MRINTPTRLWHDMSVVKETLISLCLDDMIISTGYGKLANMVIYVQVLFANIVEDIIMTAMLDREFQTFQENKPNLVKNHKGKFVLIKDDKIIGIFENELDAVKQGNEQFKDSHFLVNEITDEEFKIRFMPNLVRVR